MHAIPVTFFYVFYVFFCFASDVFSNYALRHLNVQMYAFTVAVPVIQYKAGAISITNSKYLQ